VDRENARTLATAAVGDEQRRPNSLSRFDVVLEESALEPVGGRNRDGLDGRIGTVGKRPETVSRIASRVPFMSARRTRITEVWCRLCGTAPRSDRGYNSTANGFESDEASSEDPSSLEQRDPSRAASIRAERRSVAVSATSISYGLSERIAWRYA